MKTAMTLFAALGHVGQILVDWSIRARVGAGAKLRPLTAEYQPGQHEAYVSHLTRALDDPTIRNIALTGRYGAGKSSVVAEFSRLNRRRVLLLALSTLGPDDSTESRTNQIEKELVKQLLHRERPSALPQSRYMRIDRLRWTRAALDAAAALAVVGVGLWLFGAFPEAPGLEGDEPVVVRVGAVAVVGLAAVMVLAWIRLALHNRFEVSEVSAGGASVTLARQATGESYFDRYLDEIVYFFEVRRRVDVVVFEDLDRFDEPGIFEAIRELNTLLNNSRQITARKFWWSQPRTIRFVYALKDSIFEQLGKDTKETHDLAEAETIRANRTKFFDLVIPMVPFITHSTARDILGNLLKRKDLDQVPEVGEDLIDLVGRYVPDMRLMTNIRNEFAVFARRLITEGHGMDTLTADQLFALVTYKNFHLNDFELLPLGRSDLDEVYRFSRRLITSEMATRRARLRKLSDGIALQRAANTQAQVWGERLRWFADKVDEGASNASISHYTTNGTDHQPNVIGTAEFWRDVLAGDGITLKLRANTNRVTQVSLTMAELADLVGNGFKPGDWTEALEDAQQAEARNVTEEISILRAADFRALAERPDFGTQVGENRHTFRAFVEATIQSELGRALINDGHIDRYYNLYSAQYYGDWVPTNAMSFIVQNVDTNTPDINYPFNYANEIAALLKETKGSFLSDVSAYNLDIVDHLFNTNDNRVHQVLDKVRTQVGEHERAFLDAYLAEGKHAQAAVAYLAGKWPALLTEIIEAADLSHDNRVQLVDTALANATADIRFDITNAVEEFLKTNLTLFATLAPRGTTTDAPNEVSEMTLAEVEPEDVDPTDDELENAVRVLRQASMRCANLSALRQSAATKLVAERCFDITASNLRVALNDPPTLGLDAIRNIDDNVYQYVLANSEAYMNAIDNDYDPDEVADSGTGPSADHLRTLFSIGDPAGIAAVATDLTDRTQAEQFHIFSRANPKALVRDITAVPVATWEALTQSRRIASTLENVDAYLNQYEEINNYLADILTAAGEIDVPDAEAVAFAEPGPNEPDDLTPLQRRERMMDRVASAVLQAADSIPDAKARVDLVASLRQEHFLSLDKVPAESGTLLGYLLAEGICEDTHATFTHFDTNSWETLRFAINNSDHFAEFVDTTILGPDMTTELLRSESIAANLKALVLGRFDEFVLAGDEGALHAAGQAAVATGTFIGTDRLMDIVNGTVDTALAVQLAAKFTKEMNPDQTQALLSQAPDPYSRLGVAGSTFNLPKDKNHTLILNHLEKGGRITTSTPKSLIPGKSGSGIDVTVN